jgi:Tfp pilus assembly protein PilF
MNPDDHPENKTKARLARMLSRFRAFELRDAWWQLLDLLEKRRALRRMLYAAGAMMILGAVVAIWIYPWWRQRTAVGMARQWLEAGRLDHASASIQEALRIAPEQPESWKLAADLARRLGNEASAARYSRQAADLAPDQPDLTLAWASDALLADLPDDSQKALNTLQKSFIEQSAHAQRILGELARRRQDLDTARTHFENALRIEGPLAINEVPLAVVLLKARDPALRQRGLDLLAKWSRDPEWGANTSRTLLQDAIVRNDHPAMRIWGETLRAHPRCTLGDIPNCLLALSKTDETRFSEVVAVMEKNHAVDSGNIALLVSWLNQIGRSREALHWVTTLPATLTRQPPAAVGIAEAFRMQGDWSSLLEWTQGADWGLHLEPILLAYKLKAAREIKDSTLEQSLWSTLQARAVTDGGRTLFTADTLLAWGLRDQAVTLLWSATDLPDVSIKALGTLARLYQVERDARGQFQVFKRLHSLRPRDPSITNNYALFAALTRNDPRQAEDAAKANFTAEPANLAYRSTYAVVLYTQNRADEALALFADATTDWKKTPAITLAYGLALAGAHRNNEAREVLASLSPDTLAMEEILLIENALR